MNNKAKILNQYKIYLDFQEFKKTCEQIANGEIKKNATYYKRKKVLEKFDDYLDFLKYKNKRYMLIRNFIDEHTRRDSGRSIINSCDGSLYEEGFYVFAKTCQNQTLSVYIPMNIFLVGKEDELKSYIIRNMSSRCNN